MTNPLIGLNFDVPFDEIRPEHVEPAIDELLASSTQAIEAIIKQSDPPTYANTLAALEDATWPLELAMAVVEHLESVATTDALRKAHNAVIPKVSGFWSALTMNEGLYKAIKAYSKTAQAKTLPKTQGRFLKKTLKDFHRNGADLNPTDKRQLQAIEIELTKLTTQFSQNVLDETNAFEWIASDESQLAGLPPNAKKAAKENAKAKGIEGWRFTLHAPSSTPVLLYLDDAHIRELFWRAYNQRANSAERDNGPIIEQILELRQRKAHLLGYTNFSDFVAEDRMSKNGSTARCFIEDLRARTRDSFHHENETLAAFHRDLEGPDTPELQPWDINYYAEKQRQATFDFDEEELRPYFPLEQVLTGLFEIAQSLYKIEIVERKASPWDPAVRSYAIKDNGETFATFYIDLFPRENKRGGAWMNGLISTVYCGNHTPEQLAVFCTNVNPPVGNEQALLTHYEVETLFHEFGHLLHHCFSKVSVRSLAGTHVAWDFVEFPSQIMQNWCWEREALDRFALHYKTGQPIPNELFDKMIQARTYRAANAQIRQLGFAILDLELHQTYNKDEDGSPLRYARQILQNHCPSPLPDDYAMLAGFEHLFSHPIGYAGGYYSYKWSEVLDADAFTRFKKEGIVNCEVGTAFREAILKKGNSQDPAKQYREFMGRDPELSPLLKRTGLL